MIKSEFENHYAKFSTADCATSSNYIKPVNLVKLCEAPEIKCFSDEDSKQNYEIQVSDNLNLALNQEPMMLKC